MKRREREEGEDNGIENRRKRRGAKSKGKDERKGKRDKMEEHVGKESKW